VRKSPRPELVHEVAVLSWWGKIIGGGLGFMLGGPLGALFGAAFGHNFDKGLGNLDGEGLGQEKERIQTAFFTATFATMGHVAKSDGQVSQTEIFVAEDVMRQMRLDERQKQVAQQLFNAGKQPDFPLQATLQQFRQECHRRRNLMQMFLEIQVAIALSDGKLDPRESNILQQAASLLGFSQAEYRAIFERMQAQTHVRNQPQARMSMSDAYALLGVPSGASEQEVKKAYRRQMNQHHPDKLVSKGLPEEMMALANKKVQDIREAYELVMASRKT